MHRWLILCLIHFFILLGPLTAFADELDQVTLHLKRSYQFQFAGYYAAVEQGFYRDAGMQVSLVVKQPNISSLEEILAGQADFAVGGIHLLKERLNGKPLVALASIFQHSPSALFSLKENQIRTPSDIVDRRVMTFGSGEVAVPAMLLKEGIDPESYTSIPSSYDLTDLIEGRTDLYTGHIINTAYELDQKDVAYRVIEPVDYGIDFYGDLLYTTADRVRQEPVRVKAFVDASLRGWDYALEHPDELIQLIREKYAPQLSVEQLQFEAAKSLELIRPDVTLVGHLSEERLAHIAELMLELGEVESLDAFAGFVYSHENEETLTADEIAWLRTNPKVRLIVWHIPPLIYLSEDKVEGLLIDYLSKLTSRYGVQFEYVQTTLTEALSQVENKSGVDAIPILRPSIERREDMLFSDPYLALDMAIYVKADNHSIAGLEDLAGKVTGVPRDYLAQSVLEREFPEITIRQVAGPRKGIMALATGEVEAYIGNILFASHWSQELGVANIKIAAPIYLFDPDHSLAVRSDWPELVSLFNRALADISPQENAEIRRRWIALRYEYGITKADLMKWIFAVGGGVSLVICFIFLWSLSLKKEVSRRKETEGALSRSVDQYQNLIQALPHGIIELGNNLSITYCSDPFAQLLGYVESELIGRNLFDLLGSEESSFSMKDFIVRVEALDGHQTLNVHFLSKENVLCPVQLDCDWHLPGAHERKILIVTDLSRQEETERLLVSRERTLQASFEHAQVGIVHGAASGHLIWMNQYFCSFLGYSEKELLGIHVDDITHPDDIQVAGETIAKLKAGTGDNVSFIKRYLRKDRTSIWAMISIVFIADKGEHYYVAVVQDIDDLKLQQIEVEGKSASLETAISERTLELQNRVTEVEQLNSAMLNLTEDLQLSYSQLRSQSDEIKDVNQELESFAYSVSHDLRAPLRHVQGFAEILQENSQGELSDENRSYLKTILNSAEQMGRLIDELLAFSRTGRSELSFRSLDIGKVVEECIARIQLEKSEQNIVWNIEKLPPIVGDLATMRQVFENLLSNAVKYSSPREQSVITVSADLRDSEAIFCVADNGVGFDPAYKEKLFAVFSRLHRADQFEGTGIGLANVKRIIKRHGGNVWADSDGATGARFYLSVPKAQGGTND